VRLGHPVCYFGHALAARDCVSPLELLVWAPELKDEGQWRLRLLQKGVCLEPAILRKQEAIFKSVNVFTTDTERDYLTHQGELICSKTGSTPRSEDLANVRLQLLHLILAEHPQHGGTQ